MQDVKLILYKPSIEQDCLIGHWYLKLLLTGELPQLTVAKTLTAFMNSLQSPCHLLYAYDGVDPQSIYFWFAAWFEPVFDGAFFNVWGDHKRRHTKLGLAAMEAAIEYGLLRWPLLIGVTKQENLVDTHLRLGYNLLGKLPGLWGGQDTYVLYLDQEGYDSREARLFVRSERSERRSTWGEAEVKEHKDL